MPCIACKSSSNACHTLRMPADTPARITMLYYFMKEVNIAGRQGNNNTIATALSKEYESVSNTKINDLNQFNKIVVLAQNRNAWRELVNYFIFYKNKYERELEKRRIAKQLAEERKAIFGPKCIKLYNVVGS